MFSTTNTPPGAIWPWSRYRRVMNPQATLVMVGAPKGNRLIGPLGHLAGLRLAAFRGSQKARFFIAKFNKPDLDVLRELLESGKVTPHARWTAAELAGVNADSHERGGPGDRGGPAKRLDMPGEYPRPFDSS